MTSRKREDWQRLGRMIKRARIKHPQYRDTAAWAAAVGRSSRMLLGLERGEPVGAETLMLIEPLLGWSADRAFAILDGNGEELTGDQVAEARRNRGLTREQVGDAVGVNADVIATWETLAVVPPSKAAALREALWPDGPESDDGGVLDSPVRAASDSVLLSELMRRTLAREAQHRNAAGGQ